MHDVPDSPRQDPRRNGLSLPAVSLTDRDFGEYTECMLRALERLAQTNRHEVLAKLLRLAAAEAKHIKVCRTPGMHGLAGPEPHNLG